MMFIVDSQTRTRISTTQRTDEGGTDAVSSCVSQTDGETAVGQRLPVEIVAAGLIRRLVPSGDFKVVQFGRLSRQQILLNRSGDIEIVIHLFELAVQLGFSQRGCNMSANATRDHSGENAAGQYHGGVDV